MVNGKNSEESSLSPTVASSFPNDDGAANNTASSPNNDVQAARRGLLKAIWQTTLAPRFSSRPIDLQTNNANSSASAFSSEPIEMEGYFSSNFAGGGSFVRQNSCVTVGTVGTNNDSSVVDSKRTDDFRNSLQESSYLTPSERGYLQELLQSDDLESIRRASVRLSDKEVFPTSTDSDDEIEITNEGTPEEASVTPKRKNMPLPPTSKSAPPPGPQRRRGSQVQEQLFEWHEKTTIMPSVVLKRMSSNQSAKKPPPIPPGSRTIPLNNSLTQDDNDESSVNSNMPYSFIASMTEHLDVDYAVPFCRDCSSYGHSTPECPLNVVDGDSMWSFCRIQWHNEKDTVFPKRKDNTS